MIANTVAAALASITGKPATAVCVHCLHATDPHEQYSARNCPKGGACELCSYSDYGSPRGSDMFVSLNPNLPQCPAQALTLWIVERKLAAIAAERSAA